MENFMGRNPLFIGSCSDIAGYDLDGIYVEPVSQSPLYRVMQ